MGKEQSKPHIDKDIVHLKEKYNDIVNIQKDDSKRLEVLEEISEYKLDIIQRFLFGGSCKNFGDGTVFINPAIKQVERFTYTWLNELSDESRKTIMSYYLYAPGDYRPREYKYFSDSPLWKYESSIIKMIRGYTCERCKKQTNPAHLVVHHKTYDHLGSELKHLDDVEVLCTYCHMDVHGIGGQK